MTEYSQAYGVKSNARRAARAHGVAADKVTACKGGWHFPISRDGVAANPPKKAKAPAPRRFPQWGKARAAADAAAKRAGLNPDDFVIIVLPPDAQGRTLGFVPKESAGDYQQVAYGYKPPRPGKAKPAKREKKSNARGKTAKTASAKQPGKKEATVFAMMQRTKGAAMPDICEATQWLPHTARARISGIAKKHKRDFTFDRQRIMGVSFYYARPKSEKAAA